jgi:hypothetical protein
MGWLALALVVIVTELVLTGLLVFYLWPVMEKTNRIQVERRARRLWMRRHQPKEQPKSADDRNWFDAIDHTVRLKQCARLRRLRLYALARARRPADPRNPCPPGTPQPSHTAASAPSKRDLGRRKEPVAA